MKFNQSKNLNWMLSALIVFGFAACKKLNSEGFTPGTGKPVITSVRTLSKSTVDSSRVHTTSTYTSSGVLTTTSYFDYTPIVSAFDSTTATGKLGNYYVLMGSNLGSTTKIAVNGVSIYFNRAFSSDNSVIFSIPTTVPYVQPQPNTIVVTTLHGTVTYKFTTLPPPPTITTVSDFDFWANSQLTLTGKGFASVSAVKLRATGDPITIVSQNDSTLVMKMPATSKATESTLLFTFTSGSNTGAQAASTTIFDDLDNAYTIFYQDNFQNSWFENAWAGPSGVSTAASHSGTASDEASYPSGNWAIDGWGNNSGIAYDPSYKYFSFWVKGGTVAHKIVIVGDQMNGGFNQVKWDNTPPSATGAQVITIPPAVWTYFKIPLGASQTSTNPSTLQPWLNGSPLKSLGMFLEGESGDVDETMYFDEIAFIK